MLARSGWISPGHRGLAAQTVQSECSQNLRLSDLEVTEPGPDSTWPRARLSRDG